MTKIKNAILEMALVMGRDLVVFLDKAGHKTATPRLALRAAEKVLTGRQTRSEADIFTLLGDAQRATWHMGSAATQEVVRAFDAIASAVAAVVWERSDWAEKTIRVGESILPDKNKIMTLDGLRREEKAADEKAMRDWEWAMWALSRSRHPFLERGHTLLLKGEAYQAIASVVASGYGRLSLAAQLKELGCRPAGKGRAHWSEVFAQCAKKAFEGAESLPMTPVYGCNGTSRRAAYA